MLKGRPTAIERISDLKLFIRISETNSMSAAAREFGLTPSAVSQRLATMERDLGVTLLRRTTRSQRLTSEGCLFLNAAKTVLLELDNTFSKMSLQDSRNVEPIRIGTSVELGRKIVAEFLSNFQEENLGVKLMLLVNDSFTDITESGIDLAIRIGPLSDIDLISRRVARNFRIPVAAPSYLSRYGEPIHPKDLENHNCLMQHPNCLMSSKKDIKNNTWRFKINGSVEEFKVNGNLFATNGDILKFWAISGKGIMYKTIWNVIEELTSGELVPLLVQYWGDEVDLQIVYEKGTRNNLRVDAMFHRIHQELRKLDEKCSIEILKILSKSV